MYQLPRKEIKPERDSFPQFPGGYTKKVDLDYDDSVFQLKQQHREQLSHIQIELQNKFERQVKEETDFLQNQLTQAEFQIETVSEER